MMNNDDDCGKHDEARCDEATKVKRAAYADLVRNERSLFNDALSDFMECNVHSYALVAQLVWAGEYDSEDYSKEELNKRLMDDICNAYAERMIDEVTDGELAAMDSEAAKGKGE